MECVKIYMRIIELKIAAIAYVKCNREKCKNKD